MKILIDIENFDHEHCFKNFILIVEQKEYSIFISAKDKKATFELLDHYNVSYDNRGKRKKSRFSKFLYIFIADLFLLKKILQVKSGLFLCFWSSYLAYLAFLIGKLRISLIDSDRQLIFPVWLNSVPTN